MATIKPTIAERDGWIIATWAAVTESDTCSPMPIPYPVTVVATIQVSGTLGGATVTAQGSNDGTTYTASLNDISETAIGLTAAGGKSLGEWWPYVRPSASGGTSQSLTITMAAMIDKG